MLRKIGLMVMVLALAACETTSSSAPPRVRAPQNVVPGIAYGSVYEHRVSFSDTAYMSEAFESAMRDRFGTSRDWYNPRSGARGIVRAGDAYLVGTDYARGQRLTAPIGLRTDYELEPDQGDYQAASNTNVRLGPTTSSDVVTTLPAGTVVEAIGRARGTPWMLVARGGEAIGYMHSDYLSSREGGDVLLAGGAARQPVYCREYQQTISFRNGAQDEWNGTACQDERGRWRVEGRRGAEG